MLDVRISRRKWAQSFGFVLSFGGAQNPHGFHWQSDSLAAAGADTFLSYLVFSAHIFYALRPRRPILSDGRKDARQHFRPPPVADGGRKWWAQRSASRSARLRTSGSRAPQEKVPLWNPSYSHHHRQWDFCKLSAGLWKVGTTTGSETKMLLLLRQRKSCGLSAPPKESTKPKECVHFWREMLVVLRTLPAGISNI